MSSNSFKDAKREQTSVLAPLERAALRGLVRRMPQWVNSDHLSLLGLVSMLFAGICYAASGKNPLMLHLVNLLIFLNWFGDSLDGTLARYRDRQRPRYGFYVDHIIDTFGTTFLMLGLALSGYMTERVAAAVLIVFFMLAINSYLAAYALGVFKISQWKMGPTEMRLILIIGNIYLLHGSHVHVFGQRLLLFDVGGMVSIVGMTLILVFASIKNTYTLYNLERLPVRGQRSHVRGQGSKARGQGSEISGQRSDVGISALGPE
ncbi:MAG: CDP-alcohol phosphatidyltransferase family protein [Pyrinomonadaceae bacterium]